MLLLKTTVLLIVFSCRHNDIIVNRPIYTVCRQHCSSRYSQMSGRLLYSADYNYDSTKLDCDSTMLQLFGVLRHDLAAALRLK